MTELARNKIVLVGFMGTGKSTVAKLLSDRLDMPRIDLDEAIVTAAGCSIAELFASQGEEAFRELESDVLEDIMRSDKPGVIATGGGAVLRERNRQAMVAGGLVVALRASLEQIVERVKGDRSRPLLQGNAEELVPKLLEARKHAYDFAHVSIDTTGIPVREVADRIMQRWRSERIT
jgi:shikimate kinase